MLSDLPPWWWDEKRRGEAHDSSLLSEGLHLAASQPLKKSNPGRPVSPYAALAADLIDALRFYIDVWKVRHNLLPLDLSEPRLFRPAWTHDAAKLAPLSQKTAKKWWPYARRLLKEEPAAAERLKSLASISKQRKGPSPAQINSKVIDRVRKKFIALANS